MDQHAVAALARRLGVTIIQLQAELLRRQVRRRDDLS
jgi:hypothetical protein